LPFSRRDVLRMLILGILVVVAGGCGSEEMVNPLLGNLRGITETNESGSIVGPVDEDDWGCLESGSETLAERDRHAAEDGGFARFGLCCGPAYPNPCSKTTRIDFSVPRSGRVVLFIIDRGGSVIHTLVDKKMGAGNHFVVWDCRDSHGRNVEPGTYRCVMTFERYIITGDIYVEG